MDIFKGDTYPAQVVTVKSVQELIPKVENQDRRIKELTREIDELKNK